MGEIGRWSVYVVRKSVDDQYMGKSVGNPYYMSVELTCADLHHLPFSFSLFQCCFTPTVSGLLGTGSPGRPPRLSLAQSLSSDRQLPFFVVYKIG